MLYLARFALLTTFYSYVLVYYNLFCYLPVYKSNTTGTVPASFGRVPECMTITDLLPGRFKALGMASQHRVF